MTTIPKKRYGITPRVQEAYIRCYLGLGNAQLMRNLSTHCLRLYELIFIYKDVFDCRTVLTIKPMMKTLRNPHTSQRR